MIGSWTDLTMLGDPLKEIAATAGPLPLAVSTDEEGGRVSRLKSLIGVQESAASSARRSRPPTSTTSPLARARRMKELGITVDFAPDADVSDQGDDTVIGDRSFSDDPQKVTEYAGAYARGLLEAGVTPGAQALPRPRHASGDSHEGGVVHAAAVGADERRPRALPRARAAARHRVMLATCRCRADRSDPASLNPAAYDLLRTGGYGACRSTACSPTTSPAWAPSTRATPWPRRPSRRFRRAPTSRCGSPPTRFPGCSTRSSRRRRR